MTTVDPLNEGDNRPPVYYEGDTLIIRASALGNSCLWELAAAGQGYEPATLPESLVRAFRAGHELEPMIAQMLVDEHGFRFESHQDEGHLILVLDDGSIVKVRFHSDGIASVLIPVPIEHYGQEQYVVEIKALGDDNYQKAIRGSVGDCVDEYPWQLSVMMLATGLPAVWCAYNKGKPEKEVDGIVQSELCPDKGKLHLEWVDTPPISYDEIVEKVRAIKAAVEGDDVVGSGQRCDDPDHWPCRYLHLRPEVERGDNKDLVDVAPEYMDRANQLVKNYLHHKGVVDEAKVLQDRARDELIQLLGEGRATYITDKWIIPVTFNNNHPVDWTMVSREAKAELDAAKGDVPGNPYLRGIKRRD